jgi:hypothetical protein
VRLASVYELVVVVAHCEYVEATRPPRGRRRLAIGVESIADHPFQPVALSQPM